MLLYNFILSILFKLVNLNNLNIYLLLYNFNAPAINYNAKIFHKIISIYYFIEELYTSNKDFQVNCVNASMFLIMMSLLKKSHSLDVVSKEYYDLLNFEDWQIKFLRIYWLQSNLYPVNWFEGDGWEFQKYKENNKGSLSAYALFKFLVYSNFIYSLQELQIWLYWKEDNFENDINDLLETFRKSTIKLINIKIFVIYKYPNMFISNPKLDLEYVSYHNLHDQSYDELYELVAKSTVYDTLPSNRLDRFIYKLTHEDKQYTNEIEILIQDLLQKRGNLKRNIYYLNIISKWYFSANFDFIENDVFDWSISVYNSKINTLQEIKDLANKIEK